MVVVEGANKSNLFQPRPHTVVRLSHNNPSRTQEVLAHRVLFRDKVKDAKLAHPCQLLLLGVDDLLAGIVQVFKLKLVLGF